MADSTDGREGWIDLRGTKEDYDRAFPNGSALLGAHNNTPAEKQRSIELQIASLEYQLRQARAQLRDQ